jgi:phage terminase large subunit GpA-like protein
VAAPGAGLEGAIYAGLEKLVEQLAGKEWHREDGANMRISRILIDAGWGQSTDTVYKFCRQSAHAALLLPSHGRYVGASSVPWELFKRRAGETLGNHWMVPPMKGKRAIRHIIMDTNHWKTFVHARLRVPKGDKTALMINGTKPDDLRLLSEHLTAEYCVQTEGRGRRVDEWKANPGRPDNHWLDCLVGCAVAASICGVVPYTAAKSAKPPAPKKVRAAVSYL